MLKRKNYWLLFAVLLLALTSLSPSMELDTAEGDYPPRQPQRLSEQPDSGDKNNVTSLNIRVSMSSGELKALQRISSNFTLSTGIQVFISNVDNEENAAMLKTELATMESPDIIMTDGRNIADLATRGYLLPVDVYQSVPGSVPLTVLIPQMQWNGYNWGIPLDIDPYVLVYSPQRLAELGFAEPPESLEEWGGLLNQLRGQQEQEEEPGTEKYLLAMDSRNAYGFSALLESMGLSMNGDYTPALDWVQVARSYFYLSSRFNTELWDMLQSGKLALAVLPLSEWQKNGNASLSVKAPAKSGTIYEVMQSRFFALPAGSANPETAVNWLAYITSATAQLEWLENTNRLPALEELYNPAQPEIAGLPFDINLLIAEEDVTAQPDGLSWDAVSDAVTLLLTGKLDAAEYTAATGLDSE
ncbi:Bacterial extracellular solute-binding protein [compost metagenome]